MLLNFFFLTCSLLYSFCHQLTNELLHYGCVWVESFVYGQQMAGVTYFQHQCVVRIFESPFMLCRLWKWGWKWRGSIGNGIICKTVVAWVTVLFFRRWISGGFSFITFPILSMEVQHFCVLISEQYRKHVNFALVNLSRCRIVCVAPKLNFLAFKKFWFYRISNFVFVMVMYGCMDWQKHDWK